MAPIALLFGFVAASWWMVRRASTREGYFSTPMFFAIGCFVYYFAIPFEMLVRHTYIITATVVPIRLERHEAVLIMLMATAAVIAFSFGYELSGFNPYSNAPQQPRTADSRIPRSLVFLGGTALLIASAFLVLVPGTFSRISSYTEVYQLISANPLLPVLLLGIYVPCSIIAGVLLYRRGPSEALRAAALIGLLVVLSLVVKRKEALTMALLAGVVPFAGVRRRSLWQVLAVVLAVVVAFIGFQAYSAFRGNAEISRRTLFTRGAGIVASSDAGGPFASLAQTVRTRERLRLGSTYGQTVTLLLPRTVWPGRPLDLATSFARDNIPHWRGETGSGFSFLAEAYLNFGWLGSVIQFFVFGWLWGYGWRWVRRRLSRFNYHAWRSTYVVVGFFLLLTLHRGTVAVIFKEALLFILPVLLMSAAFDARKTRPRALGVPQPLQHS
jgi:hypothetical protein